VTPVGGSTSYSTSGKTGQCLSCNGSTYWNISGCSIGNNATIAWWSKTTTNNKMPWVIEAPSAANWTLNCWEYTNYYLNVGDSTNNPFKTDSGANISCLHDGNWHHFAITFDSVNAKLYIDGEYKGKAQTYRNPTSTVLRIAGGAGGIGSPGHTYDWNGNLNDFRVYDHCLSVKEIHEISKALVLHYKLDNLNGNVGNVNLIANGWGGTDNWSLKTSSYVSTSVPNVSGITNSYINGTNTLQYIPLDSTHTYTMSGYVKRPSTANTTCYLALIPYDVDKNRIHYTNIDFKTSSLTTITQDLNSGDTVIHLANVNGWSNPSTHQNYVAIFGYKNSFGYTYPDLVYTRKIYAYGTTKDKSNIDLQNKTVTLLSPYPGQKIPSGTSICLSSDGYTYYYPKTYYATDSDWHLISASFKPNATQYLKAAAYVQAYAMSQNYTAGLTLVDTSVEPTIVDCSGYGNNGTITGRLMIGKDSSRYDSSTLITDGLSNYITSPQINIDGKEITLNIWVKSTNTSPIGSYHMPFESSSPGYCEMSIYTTGLLRGGLYVNGTRYVRNSTKHILLDGNWHMITMTYDGTTIKRYIDAVLDNSTSVTGTLNATQQSYYFGRYGTNTSYGCKDMQLSDARLYSTALSSDDIADLYHTSAFIDNLGDLHSFEIVEKSLNILQIENLNEFAKSKSNYTSYTTRNGVKAFPVRPNWYASPYTTMIGKFKENTQYLFDVWIDTDDVVYQDINRPGGFYIYYTDGSTATECIKTGDHSSPIGWQHILVITPAGKTVSKIGIYYYTSTAFYVRADSFITELKDTNIYRNGTTETGQFVEDTDVAFIGVADFNANRINEI
jgi:hypothetical protein